MLDLAKEREGIRASSLYASIVNEPHLPALSMRAIKQRHAEAVKKIPTYSLLRNIADAMRLYPL